MTKPGFCKKKKKKNGVIGSLCFLRFAHNLDDSLKLYLTFSRGKTHTHKKK